VAGSGTSLKSLLTLLPFTFCPANSETLVQAVLGGDIARA